MPYMVKGGFHDDGPSVFEGIINTATQALTMARGLEKQNLQYVTITDSIGARYTVAEFAEAVTAGRVHDS